MDFLDKVKDILKVIKGLKILLEYINGTVYVCFSHWYLLKKYIVE